MVEVWRPYCTGRLEAIDCAGIFPPLVEMTSSVKKVQVSQPNKSFGQVGKRLTRGPKYWQGGLTLGQRKMAVPQE
eukprot:3666859-Amphidinium_carterae.4